MRETMEKLLAAREPTYALADVTLDSLDEPHGAAVDNIVAMLTERGLYRDA